MLREERKGKERKRHLLHETVISSAWRKLFARASPRSCLAMEMYVRKEIEAKRNMLWHVELFEQDP